MSDTSTNSTWIPKGSLTIERAAQAREELLARVSLNSPFTVDMQQVERIDTAGLQLLLSAKGSGLCTITGIPDALKTKLGHIGCLELLTY